MDKTTEKIIGYRGLISGELMLYMSRILYHLGLKVLVCDCSPDKELKYVIPESGYGRVESECSKHRSIVNECMPGDTLASQFMPSGTLVSQCMPSDTLASQGMEYGSSNKCVETDIINNETAIPRHMVNECMEYSGIMHNCGLFDDELLKQFDTVLINFGFTNFHDEMERCNYFYYITDMDKINVDKLLNMKPDVGRMNKDHLLIQNVIRGGIAAYACADEIMKRLSIATCSLIKLNKKDIKIKSYAQYNNRFKFQDISKDLYDYLYYCIWNIYSNTYDKKQICKAIDIAMKGH